MNAQHLPKKRTRLLLRVPHVATAMLTAIAVIASLSYWDEKREADGALEELAREQTTIAKSLADQIEGRFSVVTRDASIIAEEVTAKRPVPDALGAAYARWTLSSEGKASEGKAHNLRRGDAGIFSVSIRAHGNGTEGDTVVDLDVPRSKLLAGFRRMERRNDMSILVQTPNDSDLSTLDGRRVAAPFLTAALAEPRSWIRLSQDEAASVGLPRRTAVAGLARIDEPFFGKWGVIVVESAERQRDREYRARFRLVLSVLLASGLVFGFGVIIMRQQREQLELASELAIAELQQERDERLVRASKAATLGTLAMGIAHEISTPLGVIVGRAEQLFQRASGDDKMLKSLKTILEQSDRITRVIRAFLTLARGGSPPHNEIRPAHVVRDAAALVEHVFAKGHVTLAIDVAQELPLLHGDQALIEQALVNVLLNACHACSRGGHVEVGAKAHAGAVCFFVLDDGSGISPAAMARATEPFFTTKPIGEGTGLGLAIVNEIVKNHRGKLILAPRAPRGTRVTIELPLRNGETPGGTGGGASHEQA